MVETTNEVFEEETPIDALLLLRPPLLPLL